MKKGLFICAIAVMGILGTVESSLAFDCNYNYDKNKDLCDEFFTEDYQEKLAKKLQSAKDGNVEDQLFIAYAYEVGMGFKPDIKETIKWYKIAALEGESSEAQYLLGGIYRSGAHCEKNIEEAIKWYTMASKQGDGSASYSLGIL